VAQAQASFKKAIEGTGGRLPAEHGHGTEYSAPQDMQERWKRTDPLNVMNPGVGGTSYCRSYNGAQSSRYD
jgi:D-lactate dehydrogenase